MYDDIPEAIRQPTKEATHSRVPLITMILGIVGIGVASILFLVLRPSQPAKTAANSSANAPVDAQAIATPTPTTAAGSPDELLGHLRYEIAPPDELEAVTSAPDSIQVRPVAAAAYREMSEAAQAAGITLELLSGFRTEDDQNHLFFDVKKARNQAVQTRAEVSAPPNYSEHHTGYAIDIGDATRPETHLSESFETTPAFAWLQANAARYSFELSFPQNNAQGVSYEPWHWRFVGDQDSLETFYRARQLGQQLP